MKLIHSSESVDVPSDIKVQIKGRTVTVTGPRGKLTKSFHHQLVDIKRVKNKIVVEKWFGTPRNQAVLRTLCSHIKNMFIGVKSGFRYKMRFVYAHFPINATVPADGSFLEVRNFLGEKLVRHVKMLDGVKITRSEKVKDEVVLEGNSIDAVSQSAANITGAHRVTDKDIRKFLDGIYVSHKGLCVDEE